MADVAVEIVGLALMLVSPGLAIAATSSLIVGLGYHQWFDDVVH
jgi:hypothetical protein